MLRSFATLCAIGICSTVGAVEVLESSFRVEFTHDGQASFEIDTVVPYLPDSACYNWYLHLDAPADTALTLVETLTLPEPLAAWKDFKNDPAAETQISADAQSAVSTLNVTTDGAGWVSHGWCVAAGDPLGPHNLAVTLDGKPIGSWDFTVVAEADYTFRQPEPEPEPEMAPPPPQPSPRARDVNQSW